MIERIEAEKLEPGMNVKLWYGTHNIIRIKPYTGIFAKDGCFGIMEFATGVTGCSLWKGEIHEIEVAERVEL